MYRRLSERFNQTNLKPIFKRQKAVIRDLLINITYKHLTLYSNKNKYNIQIKRKTDCINFFPAPGKVSYFTVIQDSNVMEQTNVHIAWRPPIDRDLNGIIKNYYLQYWYQTDQKRVRKLCCISMVFFYTLA